MRTQLDGGSCQAWPSPDGADSWDTAAPAPDERWPRRPGRGEKQQKEGKDSTIAEQQLLWRGGLLLSPSLFSSPRSGVVGFLPSRIGLAKSFRPAKSWARLENVGSFNLPLCQNIGFFFVCGKDLICEEIILPKEVLLLGLQLMREANK